MVKQAILIGSVALESVRLQRFRLYARISSSTIEPFIM